MHPRIISLSVALGLFAGASLQAQTLGADFASNYTVANLGSVPGLPNNYGGLAFLDADTILIGGAANGALGSLYTIDVLRDAQNHVTGVVWSESTAAR